MSEHLAMISSDFSELLLTYSTQTHLDTASYAAVNVQYIFAEYITDPVLPGVF